MEALRKTLEWLFLREDPDAVLNAGRLPSRYCRDDYVLHIRELFASLTLDQIGIVMHQLDDVWVREGEPNQMRYVTGMPSLFNTLLHFSNVALSHSYHEPCVKYDSLLRWHDVTSRLTEDLFTTSFLAAKDLALGRNRDVFSWKACIDHDNMVLNNVLKKPLAELHSHLKGASLNFELNWLCLMNRPWQRGEEFRKLATSQNPIFEDVLVEKKTNSLYYLVIKAAAIRLRLVMKQLRLASNKDGDILSLIFAHSLSEQKIYLDSLKAEMGAVKHLYAKRIDNFIPDYAITGLCCEENRFGAYTILIGERAMMYHAFRDIYSRGNEVEDDMLFYVYLIIKNRFRQELMQTNMYEGFSNFGIYERRKEGFVPDGSQYSELLPAEAVASFFSGKAKGSYLEVRITPKEFMFQLDASIKKLKSGIGSIKTSDEEEQYRFVLHFIKARDNYKNGPRHRALRDSVSRRSQVLVRWRNMEFNKNAKMIVGIDAANSELYCRPEVFSQAYRFCRQNSWNQLNEEPNRLHFTYHVGEDFYDVVDGLRAVWEAIHFLGMGRGDRFGHGLVLGIDVRHYYSVRKGLVYLPKQVLLDNIVWILHEADFAGPSDKNFRELNDLYLSISQEIFGWKPLLDDYFQSICLRGDNPNLYKIALPNVSRWNQFDENEDALAVTARKNKEARCLFSQYHYDQDVVRKGGVAIEFKVTDTLIEVIDKLRKKMLDKVEGLGISIETNPTSNLKIGHFSAYDAHPLMEFNDVGLCSEGKNRGISVSINTDDRGIFGTSIEREYSLVAAALEKQYRKGTSDMPPRVIYNWLDRVREMAFEQKFD